MSVFVVELMLTVMSEDVQPDRRHLCESQTLSHISPDILNILTHIETDTW